MSELNIKTAVGGGILLFSLSRSIFLKVYEGDLLFSVKGKGEMGDIPSSYQMAMA